MWELLGVLLLLAVPAVGIGLPLWLLSLSRRNRETLERMVSLERRLQSQQQAIEALESEIGSLRQSPDWTSAAGGTDQRATPDPLDALSGRSQEAASAAASAMATAPQAAAAPPPPPPPPQQVPWEAPSAEPTTAVAPPPPIDFAAPISSVTAEFAAAQSAEQPGDVGSAFATAGMEAPASNDFPGAEAPAAPVPVDWETRLGANWLSKLGVAAMVIGLALFVGYSFTTMGAAGRVAMASLVSGAMLGGGILFERREQFRTLGRGLIAGGWAGAYLTAFAAYGVEAARVVNSPGLATVLLFVVAGGMIAHSLRYRRQALTTLAFVLAALALGISDSFGFALGGLFPLAGALLVTAHRLAWAVLRVTGALACYVTVAVLMFFGGEVMQTTLLSVVLVKLWLLFELGGWLAMRRGEAPGWPVFLLAAGNALALAGLLAGNGGLAELGALETPRLQTAMLGSGLLLALAAIVRARLNRGQATEAEALFAHLARGGYLPQAALGSACLAAFVLLRYSGALELALLMGLGLALMALALVFGQRYLARVADGLFSFSLLRLYTGDITSEPLFTFASTAWSMRALFALGHATVFYANRVLFPRRAYYSIVATVILLVTLAEALPPLWLGFGYLVATLGLLEAARRSRGLSSLMEAWGVLAVAMTACAATWLEHEMQSRLPWQPVAASGLLFYATGWQLWRTREVVLAGEETRETAGVIDQGTLLVAGVCAAIALYLLVPDIWICTVWVLLALLWSEAGRRFAQVVWPAKAMFLSIVAVAVLLAVSSQVTAIPPQEALFWLVQMLPAGALFAMWWRFSDWPTQGANPKAVGMLSWLPSALGTVVLAELASNLADGVYVGLLWMVLSLALVGAGLWFRKKDLRAQGYVVATLGACFSAILISERVGDWFQGFHEMVAGTLGTMGLLALFLVTLRLRGLVREDRALVWSWERFVPTAMAMAAGAYAVRVMFLVVEGRLLTMALGFEAIVVLALGVMANLRALRLGALGLLLFTVGKLFVYDLSSLVMPYRILSFFVLGALLLGVSWAYSRFGDRIRRLL